jgi:hypothetical protein
MTTTNHTSPSGEELKPCPFCGGAVELEQANSRGAHRWWGVVCRNTINLGGTCAIEQIPSASREAATERWNRRAAVSGEDAANGATVKPVASLVTFDEFVQYGKDHGANIVNGMPWSFVFNGHAVTHENDDLYLIGTPSIQFKRGELLVVTAFGEYRLLQVLQLPAANGAIGEREAFEALMRMRGEDYLYRRDEPGCERRGDYCRQSVQDQWEVWQARAALAAEKVAAEPTDFVFPPMPPAIVMHDKLGPLFDRLSMNFYAYKCMTIAAPQQPAQSAEQDEPCTNCGMSVDPKCACERGRKRAASTQSTAPQPAQTQVALTDTDLEKLYWTAMNNAADILRYMDEARALLAAQPVSGADHD